MAYVALIVQQACVLCLVVMVHHDLYVLDDTGAGFTVLAGRVVVGWLIVATSLGIFARLYRETRHPPMMVMREDRKYQQQKYRYGY